MSTVPEVPALRLDAVAMLTPPLPVPAKGAVGHPEPSGTFGARPLE
ncbi:hypothetical protein [Glaciihabitans sp. GrIS 2.15]|nr:hypothetical protein [Glaciihabitans sp. GrIS 2.15]